MGRQTSMERVTRCKQGQQGIMGCKQLRETYENANTVTVNNHNKITGKHLAAQLTLALNFLPVLGTFMSNTPIEDMLLFYLVFKHIFAIVAVSCCNVLTVGCLYAAMWTHFCLNHTCWSCTNIYVWP